MRNSGSGSSMNSNGEPAGAAAAGPAADATTALKKGPWSAAEDAILIEYVQRHGEGNWNSVQKNCGLARCGKSCRLRWANHLRPNLKKGSFTPEEEMLILQLHAQMGNKWARMAAQLPGRTDNEIKNFWNTRIKRRQRAGLPFYQPDLQTRHQQQQQQRKMPPSPPPPPPPAASYTSPLPHSPLPPILLHSNMFQFNYGNNYGGMKPVYSVPVKAELPSTQLLFNGGGGGGDGGGGGSGCGLLDALLQVEEVTEDFGSNGDGKDLFLLNNFGKLKESSQQQSNGITLERERPEETTPVSSHSDISKLFDTISTPSMPAAQDWHNAANESRKISNGAQSSAAADDELGLELQHLASSLTVAPAEQEWNIGSCPWSNMPRIC